MADYFQGAELLLEALIAIAIAQRIEVIEQGYNAIAVAQKGNYVTQRNFYFSEFQEQGEAIFVSEQMNVPFYVPDYIGSINHVPQWPPFAWSMFSSELSGRTQALGTNNGYWQRFGSRYSSIGLTRTDSSSYAMDIACIYDDWNSYMNRYEEHKRDIFNERRWASIVGALSYGVKEAYEVEAGLATSFRIFDKAQGELVSEGDTMLNGLATFAGYRQVQNALDKDLGTDPTYGTHFFLE